MFNNSAKRKVQRLLLKEIPFPPRNFVGLADLTNIEDTISYYKLVKSTILPIGYSFLVDKNGVMRYDNTTDERFFIDNRNPEEVNITMPCFAKSTNVIDCDFCNTYKKSGEYLIKVKENIDIYSYYLEDKALLYTFSIRGTSIDSTLKWLNKNIFDNTLTIETNKVNFEINQKRAFIKEIIHNQFLYKKSKMYLYRGSGTIMLSGIIIWNNN